jgi:hypothetical protein
MTLLSIGEFARRSRPPRPARWPPPPPSSPCAPSPPARRPTSTLGETQATPPQWPLVAEALCGWGAARGRQASELGPRVTFLATPPRLPGSAPDCDHAVPLR